MAKPKAASKRDMLAEAALEVEQLVGAYPNHERKHYYQLAMANCPMAREWLDGVGESARLKFFERLLRYSTAETGAGEKVRTVMSYKKWVHDEAGNEVLVVLWKKVYDMTREEAVDAIRDLDAHIDGSWANRNRQATYWNSLHPNEDPIPPRELGKAKKS